MLGFAAQAHAAAAKPQQPAAKAPAAPAAPAATPSGPKKYKMEDVAKHRDKSTGIWVTYKGGVYDITSFVEAHPGGMQKIMLAAGGSIEPFWGIYQQHNKKEVHDILAQYKIGELEGGPAPSAALADPFKDEPSRHPALIARSAKPCNAETPGDLLSASLITPTDLFYVRNHLPVPTVDPKAWKLRIEGEGLRTVELSLEELQTRFRKHVQAATIQCAGNRRSEMKQIKPVKGLDWDIGAIGTATWGGVLLRDVLKYAGFEDGDPSVAHVHFVGLDNDPLTGEVYAASIPVHKAVSPEADVLLAYEMNGAPLTRDHGAPVRVVAPGIIGARNVKWLSKVSTSAEECQGFWQQKDYKSFSPSVDWDTVDWNSSPAIQESPITSAVCEPKKGDQVYLSDGEVSAHGYAFGSGGRDVMRVDVSIDGGKTWSVATLKKLPQQPGKAWAWCHWQATLPLPAGTQPGSKVELVCRALDEACSAQPDSVAGLWNLRGVLNNAWHRVELEVVA